MNTPSLFHGLPPYVRGSETSREAAEAIAPDTPTLRRAVLEYLRSRGPTGATDDEMQTALGMHAHTQCPRRIELVSAGLVVKSGEKRPTRSGRAATVWTAVTKPTE